MAEPGTLALIPDMLGEYIPLLKGLVSQYGLFGILMAAFIGSTIFVPLTVEILFPILLKADINPYLVIIFASIGALAGSLVNYGVGRFGVGLIEKRIGADKIASAKAFMDKYGVVGLFLIVAVPLPLPIPVDPVTIIPGMARMSIVKFSAVIFISKIIRYALWVGVLNKLLGM